VLDAFRTEYVRRYGAGSMMAGTPLELVALRAVGTGAPVLGDAPAPRLDIMGAALGELRSGRTRAVRSGPDDGAYAQVDVFDDAELAPGWVVRGPALVDRSDTVIWVPEGVRASRDGNGSIVLEVS
jgi:N-methylhydantoinase A